MLVRLNLSPIVINGMNSAVPLRFIATAYAERQRRTE
jgi:hypothetical protein